MGDPTHYFVDPSGGDDTTGTGAIGAPWKTVDHALTTITQDSTDGDQINIKDTADDVLSSSLAILVDYGTPSSQSPLVFRGYTSAANDGGIGGIDGNDNAIVNLGTIDHLHFIDLHLHNSGGSSIFNINRFCHFINCEIDDTTGDGVSTNYDCLFVNCHFHSIGSYSIDMLSGGFVFDCYFAKGSRAAIACVRKDGPSETTIAGNIMSVDGTTDGIICSSSSWTSHIYNNSILSNGGTGQGVFDSGQQLLTQIYNNVIEGFSGTGGVGIDFDNNGWWDALFANNSIYNCATAADLKTDVIDKTNSHETLGSSPFAKSGSDTFANRYTYFAPLNVGEVWGGAYGNSSMDRGAVQHSGGGGGAIRTPSNAGRFGIVEA